MMREQIRLLSIAAKDQDTEAISGSMVQKGAKMIPRNTAIGADWMETKWLHRMDDIAVLFSYTMSVVFI